MRLNRNLKILIVSSNIVISIIITSFIIGIVIPFIVNNNSPPDDNQHPSYDWNISIYGNVNYEVNITYEDIVEGVYGVVENREFYFINSYGTEYYINYTGAPVWNILNQTGVLTNTSSKIVFYAIDNYYSYELSISDFAANPEYAILAFKKNGEFILPQQQGGYGPIRAIVDYEITKPRVNSQYWVKYTSSIQIK
jgi:DMSO/TMAO reductase YedYZ molybdopterin-dependent catalytic subunit